MSWVGAQWGETHKPWRGLGHRETRGTLAYRHPPVEPALCHRGHPTVAGEGWGAESHDQAAMAGPGHPPDCVLARGTPPPVSPPHHGEVTRPWAAVGVVVSIVSWCHLDGCRYFLVASGWLLSTPGGNWMVAANSWWHLVVLDRLHKIHVHMRTNVIILLIHEICMHMTIYIIRLLNLGFLSPSHALKSMTDDPFGHHCC